MLKKSIATSYLIDAKIDYDSINELSRKIFMELQYNTFGRMEEEDVLGHISNFLRILDLIKIMIFDTDRLHLNIFPLSLTKAARVWWSSNKYSKITAWGILTGRFFCNYFPLSLDGKNYGSNNHKDDEHGYYELMAWIDSKHDNKGIDRMTKSTLCHAWVYGWGNDESDNDIVSSDEEWEEHEYGNPPNIVTNLFTKPNLDTHYKGDGYNHIKWNENRSEFGKVPLPNNVSDEGRMCKTESLKL
ncbi:hypothetical protein Tco_1271609 [Tanacetum coccineum]